MNRLLTFSYCSLILFSMGCFGSKKDPVVAVADERELIDVREVGFVDPDPSAYRNDIGIRAYGEGALLVISLHNKGQRIVRVTPMDFAVITGTDPSRDLVLVDAASANLRRTPEIELEPDSKKVMRIEFRSLYQLKGYRLVYNNPREQIRFYVTIE